MKIYISFILFPLKLEKMCCIICLILGLTLLFSTCTCVIFDMIIKPTETFQYTHFSSCHPPSVKIGFVKGEALRLLRTNSSKATFEENISKFKKRLRTRGYPKIHEKGISA